MFLARDGETAKVSDGERIPIPQTTTTDQGTVTVTGVSYAETSVICSVALREHDGMRAILGIDVELSDVLEFVGVYPRTRSRTLHTKTSVAAGGLYLVGRLESRGGRRETRSIFRSVNESEDVSGRVLIWVRAFRIKSTHH